MSVTPTVEPVHVECDAPAIEIMLAARPRTIDSFSVGRVLPAAARRLVGPFCFLDHLGPAQLAPGQAMDVRPHPHINLATVSYVLEGEILHRDSLGSSQVIRPGAINWMSAGRGIVHSERTPAELRKGGAAMHMLQLWVALPREHEESEPSFQHHPADTLPELMLGDVKIRVLAGSAFGQTSPVKTLSRLFFADVQLPAGASIDLPNEHYDRAAYVISGELGCSGERIAAQSMAVFAPTSRVALRAETDTRMVVLGGAPLDGPRYMEWNFVSSRKERIEQAKDDWRKFTDATPALRGSASPFSLVPGDEQEFIPLP
jgi:redox-sensitive bicupin YhaK (pirin superfamily)